MLKRKSGRKSGKRPVRRRGFFALRKKRCRFCTDKIEDIDYKNIARLEKFITERGKILPSRISGNCARHQRLLARALKRARAIALMPYIVDYR